MPKVKTRSGLYKLYVFFFMGLMLVSLFGGLALKQIEQARHEAFAGTTDEFIEVKKVRKSLEFNLISAASGTKFVPRNYLDRLPRGLPKIRNVHQKKELFSTTLLPLILLSNELILIERERLLTLRAQMEGGAALAGIDIKWLKQQRKLYNISTKIEPSLDLIDRLLHHSDIIPPSLALAQAAIESGWGTSRFAQMGNALFGQWVWGDDADGMLPLGREEGATHKVRKFNYLIDSVRAYAHNINKNRAYEDVRIRRATLRREGRPISGPHLAEGLIKYSERGEDYIKDVLNLISYNQFSGLDHSRLEPSSKNELQL